MTTKQLLDVRQSGVHQLTGPPEEIEQAARQAGLAVFRIDAGHARSKKALLDSIATALHFPDWFGNNWDSLNDCLTDLDWLPTKTGYVLIFENMHNFDEALEVFRAVSEYWRAEGRPFWVFV
jgi:RNAse (barnase) inhibitor barstar